MDILSKNIDFESCILSQTDSTTAAGWLRKSNFADSEDEIVQMTTARHLATLIIESKCCLYSQWFPGDENAVSDALSRYFHLSNHELSNLINNFALEQVPFGIEILNLPIEISSWLTYLLQNQPVKEQWSKEQTRSSLYLGAATTHTFYQLDVTKTLSSKNFQEHNDTESWQPLLTQSKKVDLVLNLLNKSKRTQSEPPWIMWHRPLSWLTSLTQDWTMKENLHTFYSSNYDTTQTMIPLTDNRPL
jgi:hypothetical protein